MARRLPLSSRPPLIGADRYLPPLGSADSSMACDVVPWWRPAPDTAGADENDLSLSPARGAGTGLVDLADSLWSLAQFTSFRPGAAASDGVRDTDGAGRLTRVSRPILLTACRARGGSATDPCWPVDVAAARDRSDAVHRWRMPALFSFARSDAVALDARAHTGAGKSLCYQLPAMILNRRFGVVTLVVTPLVALMVDQLQRLPPGLRGDALHANRTVRLFPSPGPPALDRLPHAPPWAASLTPPPRPLEYTHRRSRRPRCWRRPAAVSWMCSFSRPRSS